MAWLAFGAKVGGTLGNGETYCVPVSVGASPNITSTGVESAVATLEADGASPTQGHVNSLRTAWNLIKTPIDALPGGADVRIEINRSVAPDGNSLRSALRAVIRQIGGFGLE